MINLEVGGVKCNDESTRPPSQSDGSGCDDETNPLDVVLVTILFVIVTEVVIFVLIRLVCRRFCGGRSIEIRVIKGSNEGARDRNNKDGGSLETPCHIYCESRTYAEQNVRQQQERISASHSICDYLNIDAPNTPSNRAFSSRVVSLNNWGFVVEDETQQSRRTHRRSSSLSSITTLSATSPAQSVENLTIRDDFALLDEFPSDMQESQTITVGGKLVVYKSALVDHNGATLTLDKMGISLYIAPGAIEEGREEKIFLILNWDLADFPSMLENQTIISPVVHCGPHGLQLRKPAVLSYKHCADDATEVQVWSSETNLLENKQWNVTPTADDGSEPYAILANECQIQLAHFTLYTCLAQGGQLTKKWLQLVAFGGKMRPHQHFEIRVYFLNNTPCALQYAIQNEEKQGFKQLGTEWKLLFHGSNDDMFLKVESINEGWSCGLNLDDRQEKISFLSIWHGKCPHISFVFKHENRNVRDISVKLSAYQESMESEKRTLRIVNRMKRGSVRSQSESWSSSQSSLTDADSVSSYSSRSTSRSSFNLKTVSSTYTVPYKLRRELIMLLDPPSVLGNDWRILAEALGADAQIPMLRNERNPTDCLLEEVEHQGKSLGWLADVLQEKKRLDAATVIKGYIDAAPKKRKKTEE